MHGATVRRATPNDLAEINRIYNQAVLDSTAIMDNVPLTIDETRVWYESHDAAHPICVCELDSSVVGWAAVSRLFPEAGFWKTGEVLFFVDRMLRGKSVGFAMLSWLINETSLAGQMHSLLALVTVGNLASVNLLTRSGFKHVGRWEEVSYKFGEYHGLDSFQLLLPTSPNHEVRH